MKIALLLLCSISLLFAQLRTGNFTIRFEPTAVLQAKVPVPFQIHILDGDGNPIRDARVDLEIARPDGSKFAKFKAPQEDRIRMPGVYLAKPVFPEGGEWNVTARVEWQNAENNRTIEFDVKE